MTLFFATVLFIAICLLGHYLFNMRTIRILMDPDDKQSFNTVVAIINSKKWRIFATDYIDHYEDMTIVDLTVPNVFFNKVYDPLLNLNTIDVLEAK